MNIFDNNPNPMIADPTTAEAILFRQTHDSTMDAEVYSRFIYSIENQFRRSRFYKFYKSSIMNLGINYDQEMRNVNDEMATIEMHHHLPTLNQASIMISEHLMNTKGFASSMEVLYELEQAHRNNWMGVIMLSTSMHQAYHSDPSAFISLRQCIGDPFMFLNKYYDGLTLDIAFKWLLQLKLEDQNNSATVWMNIPRQREKLLEWGYMSGNILTQ